MVLRGHITFLFLLWKGSQCRDLCCLLKKMPLGARLDMWASDCLSNKGFSAAFLLDRYGHFTNHMPYDIAQRMNGFTKDNLGILFLILQKIFLESRF